MFFVDESNAEPYTRLQSRRGDDEYLSFVLKPRVYHAGVSLPVLEFQSEVAVSCDN
jgi:hypothetical protein